MRLKMKAARKRRNENGLALIGLMVIILVLGVIVYAFSTMVASHQMSAESGYNAMKAFYIKEGALELGMKFVVDRWAEAEDCASYTPLGENYAIFSEEEMGEGTFSVWVTETAVYCGSQNPSQPEFYAVGTVSE